MTAFIALLLTAGPAGYLLYSIGRNLKDDDGKAVESGSGDLTVRAER